MILKVIFLNQKLFDNDYANVIEYLLHLSGMKIVKWTCNLNIILVNSKINVKSHSKEFSSKYCTDTHSIFSFLSQHVCQTWFGSMDTVWMFLAMLFRVILHLFFVLEMSLPNPSFLNFFCQQIGTNQI